MLPFTLHAFKTQPETVFTLNPVKTLEALPTFQAPLFVCFSVNCTHMSIAVALYEKHCENPALCSVHQHCALCTQHCALCTQHCALCTVHPALCTVHPALCTVHPALCTLHPALCTVHPALCTVHTALGTVHPALCTVHPALYAV